MKLLIATRNKGKIEELREMLADLKIDVGGLTEFEGLNEPEETGETFGENARLKASQYAVQTGHWTLSDDSGLVVDALGGAPGVYSARYAGENASDSERIAKLLLELDKTDEDQRSARFVCAVAVSDETGKIRFFAEGVCDGRIAREAVGENGFGYDPIFVPTGFSNTFGVLSQSTKAEISHRAKAIAKIIRFLRDFRVHQLDQ